MSLLFKGAALKASVELAQIIQECGDTTLANAYARLEEVEQALGKVSFSQERDKWSYLNNLAWEMDFRIIEEAQKYGFDTRFMDLTWKDVQQHLGEREVAIEFECYPCGKDEVQYLALVLKKGWSNPRMLPLFKKSDLDTLSVGQIPFRRALTSEQGKDELYGSVVLGQMVCSLVAFT